MKALRTYAISHYRYRLELMTGVGGKRGLLSGGTEFLAKSNIVLFALIFHHFGAATAISSTTAVVICGIEWEMFAHRGEFPRVILIWLIEVSKLRVTGIGLLWIILILTSECVWDVCVFGLCGGVPFVSGILPCQE